MEDELSPERDGDVMAESEPPEVGTVYLLIRDRMGSSEVREVYASEEDANAVADAANDHWRAHDGSDPYSVEAFDVVPKADADEPITKEWSMAIPGVEVEEDESHPVYKLGRPDGCLSVAWMADDGIAYLESDEGKEVVVPVSNRGELRLLCKGLGVPLKEVK